MVFSLGRLDGPARHLSGWNNGNDVSDLARGVASRRQRPSPPDRRFVFGDFHNLHVVREDARRFIVQRLVRQSRLFGLDDPLDLHDFPAKRIGTADVLPLELRIQLITLLASRTNDGDVHAMGSIQRRNLAVAYYSKGSFRQFILFFLLLPINP